MNRIKVSKLLSYILRHAPEKYDVTLDGNGFADVEMILSVMRRRSIEISKEELYDLVQKDGKGRFEITGNRIRARYGHSVDVKPPSKSIIPPEVLYHGTSPHNLDRILREGLKPMRRQFVHLSKDRETAYQVGTRHSKQHVILVILARRAAQDGMVFYKEKNTYLVKSIPSKYLRTDIEDL